MTPQSIFGAECDDQASSHPKHREGCDDLPCHSFWGRKIKPLFSWRKSLLIFSRNMNTCCQVITEVTKIMCNIISPKVWGWNMWQQEYFVKCMCVSKTSNAPIRNLQTIKHLHNNIPSYEVGIPILRIQVTLIICVKWFMATKHTLWIHVIMSRHSHQEYTVDLCSKRIQIQT